MVKLCVNKNEIENHFSFFLKKNRVKTIKPHLKPHVIENLLAQQHFTRLFSENFMNKN